MCVRPGEAKDAIEEETTCASLPLAMTRMVVQRPNRALESRNRTGGIGNMLFSTCSQTENGSDSTVTFGEPMGDVITPGGHSW